MKIKTTTKNNNKQQQHSIKTKREIWAVSIFIFGVTSVLVWVCLFVLGFTAQSTQWGHVERGQFT